MSICTAPVYKLEALNNLFIEMTSKSCNQKCADCYIDFPISKNVKDFISIDRIKECLKQTKDDDISCIYLTGAEPMTHPDFNTILRLCLKRSDVCICTNASFLNEKKVRFLKKVEDEGGNKIFFMLSFVHYDEVLNDKVRYRGSYRQTMSALKLLTVYDFDSIISFRNYYNLDKNEIMENLSRLLDQNGIENTELKITVSYPVSEVKLLEPATMTDCMRGRILCQNGVYSCPFLANDYRGRMGSDFSDYSDSVTAETDFCLACSLNEECFFSIDG